VKIERKAYMAGAIVLGGALYGAEVDHLTQNNMYKIRQAMGMAIWGNKGPRNKMAALLLHKQGQMEPTVKRATQLGGRWQRMVDKGHLEGELFEKYWNSIVKHTGTTKGPIHLMSKLLVQIGIRADGKHYWEMEDTRKHISEIEDVKGMIRERAKDAAWKHLA